jgi:hypothetical protein
MWKELFDPYLDAGYVDVGLQPDPSYFSTAVRAEIRVGSRIVLVAGRLWLPFYEEHRSVMLFGAMGQSCAAR